MKHKILTLCAAALLLNGCGADQPSAAAPPEHTSATAPTTASITATTAAAATTTTVSTTAATTASTTATTAAVTTTTVSTAASSSPAPELSEDKLEHLSDEELVALIDLPELGKPMLHAAFDGLMTDHPAIMQQSAGSPAEADALAKKFYQTDRSPDTFSQPELIASKDSVYRCYRSYYGNQPDHANELIVFDRAFFDVETETLHAPVTEETVRILAASFGSRNLIGSFLSSDGGQMTCSLYALHLSTGDWGMYDAVTLTRQRFTVNIKTGAVTGYSNCCLHGATETLQCADIPGTYHECPIF